MVDGVGEPPAPPGDVPGIGDEEGEPGIPTPPPPLEPGRLAPVEPVELLEPPDEPDEPSEPPDGLLGEPDDGAPPPAEFVLQPPMISSAPTTDATIARRVTRASARGAEQFGAAVFIAKCLWWIRDARARFRRPAHRLR